VRPPKIPKHQLAGQLRSAARLALVSSQQNANNSQRDVQTRFSISVKENPPHVSGRGQGPGSVDFLGGRASGDAMRCRKFIALLGGAGLLFIHVAFGNAGDGTVGHLSLPGPIEFNGESYRLSWSSHPTPSYYKQEYLPPGQTSERFQRMVLIETSVRGVDVNGAVAAQVNRLNKRKSTDPTVNFAAFKNPKNGETILDFILSAKDAKGEDVVEWNAYRYAAWRGKGGESGVLLFGISRRAYGDDATDFLRGLKSVRPAEIKALASYPLPVVRPLD
jgi:hypothetical protein